MKCKGILRMTLAANLRRLMVTAFPNHPNQALAMSAKTKVAKSTMQRLLVGEVAATLDTLEMIGDAFGIDPHELLSPVFKVPSAKESAATTGRHTRKQAA